jgi:dihydropyrimidinase
VAVGSNIVVKDGAEELHADGAYVTPGGVDAHVHLSQFHEAAIDTPTNTVVTNGDVLDIEDYPGDKYDTGTASAVAGGTTTVVTFASQLREDDSIIPVIDEYHKVAKDKAYCDYSFHVIITRPTPSILTKDLKVMVDVYGITSVKIYMTYESMKLSDHQILDVMYVARKLGITTMVHAENADMINWMTEHLETQGMTAPYHHGTSRPPIVEAEAVVSLDLKGSGPSSKGPVLTNMVEPCDLTRGAYGHPNSTRPCLGEPGDQAH